MIKWIIILFSLLSCTVIKPSQTKPIGLWLDLVKYTWNQLPTSHSTCYGNDHFPNGNMIDFYCHIKEIVHLSEIKEYFGQDIFISGPHLNGALVLDHASEFGYYNSNFPIFLMRTLIPASKDSGFKTITQPIYNDCIQSLARTFYVTYKKIHSNPIYLSRERIRYNRLRQEKILDPYYFEKYSSFMNPFFSDNEDEKLASKFEVHKGDEIYNENVVKICVGFWIRRSIDGSDKSFYEGLTLLLLTYDPQFRLTR